MDGKPPREFIQNGREIFILVLVLVMVTVVGIGYPIYWIMPSIPLISAFRARRGSLAN